MVTTACLQGTPTLDLSMLSMRRGFSRSQGISDQGLAYHDKGINKYIKNKKIIILGVSIIIVLAIILMI